MTAARANAFGDLNEFQPKPPQPRTVKAEQIDRVAQDNGFPSRQPAATSAVPRPAARRHTTGRNQQINVKATPETIARFYRLADARKVVLGQLLELALDALERGTPSP